MLKNRNVKLTPKEKAKQLINKFISYADDSMATLTDNARYCSLLCVEEILKAREAGTTGVILDKEYWEEVKFELEQS